MTRAARHGIAVALRQDVEQRFPHPVTRSGRASEVGGPQDAALQPAADDPHGGPRGGLRRPWAAALPPGPSTRTGSGPARRDGPAGRPSRAFAAFAGRSERSRLAGPGLPARPVAGAAGGRRGRLRRRTTPGRPSAVGRPPSGRPAAARPYRGGRGCRAARRRAAGAAVARGLAPDGRPPLRRRPFDARAVARRLCPGPRRGAAPRGTAGVRPRASGRDGAFVASAAAARRPAAGPRARFCRTCSFQCGRRGRARPAGARRILSPRPADVRARGPAPHRPVPVSGRRHARAARCRAARRGLAANPVRVWAGALAAARRRPRHAPVLGGEAARVAAVAARAPRRRTTGITRSTLTVRPLRSAVAARSMRRGPRRPRPRAPPAGTDMCARGAGVGAARPGGRRRPRRHAARPGPRARRAALEIDARLGGERRAELLAQHAGRHGSSTAPSAEFAELERPERDADQPGHGEAELLQHPLDLAVLALAQAHGEPDVGALDRGRASPRCPA